MKLAYTHRQDAFRIGELGDGIREQRNLDVAYWNSVEKLLNANLTTTGGVKTRGGFRFITTDLPTTDPFGHYHFCVWTFRQENVPDRTFLVRAIIFGENVADIWEVDVATERLTRKLCRITTGKPASLMQKIHWVAIEHGADNRSQKAILFTNRHVKPFLLLYKNSASQPNDFQITDVPLKNIPKHDFSYGANDRSGVDIGTGALRVVQKNTQYDVIATNDAFTTGLCPDYSGLIIKLKPVGELRVIRRKDNKTLECNLTEDLGNVVDIAPQDFTISLGYEPIASNTRGWFECCEIFQGRLFLANTYDLPNALIFSTSRFKLDFNLGALQDGDGGFVLVDTKLVDEIVQLKAFSSLMAFSKNQMYVLASGANALTPLNAGMTQISQGGGCDTFTQTPQTQTGGIVVLDSDIEKLFYVSYDQGSETYVPNIINPVLPDEYLKQNSATWSFIIINYGKTQGECAFFINRANQIVRCLLTLNEERGIPGFTRYTFNRYFVPEKLFNVGKTLYCIFRIEPIDRRCICMYDPEMPFDCGMNVTTNVNGDAMLDSDLLDGKTVAVYCPDNRAVQHVDVSSRSISTQFSQKNVVVGFDWTFLMQTHSMLGRPGVVPDLGGCKKSVRRIYVNLCETDRLRFAIHDNGHDEAGETFHDLVKNIYGEYTQAGVTSCCYGGYKMNPQLVFYANTPARAHIMGFTAGLTAYMPSSEASQ